MVSFLSGVVAALSLLGLAQAAPLADKLRRLSPSARDALKRSAPASPRFVVYSDAKGSLPHASDLNASDTFCPPYIVFVLITHRIEQGYNVFALAFLLSSGAADQALVWQQFTTGQRASYVQEYHDAGISLVVSAFGSTQRPTSSGVDPTATANTMAAWVIQNGVDGIDVDYEDFTAFNRAGGAAENWLVTFTQTLREKLPQGQYILTHAPLAPWFSPSMWSGGGYLAVDKRVGQLIDWYNVQFYNQGNSEYTTCSGLLTASSSVHPQSALFQIEANGISQDKLVLGKPATAADCTNGYMDPSTLSSCISQAASNGWNAGVAGWQYPDASSAWITTVRKNSWPVHSSRTASRNDECAEMSSWKAGNKYSSGNRITYNGYLWTANRWNQGETPGDSSGAWTDGGACA